MSRASIISRVTLGQDRVIAAGSTITVFSIIIANSTTSVAEVDIQDGDQTKTITITVSPQDTEYVTVEWIADNGLRLCGIGSDNVFVSVFHSQPGA